MPALVEADGTVPTFDALSGSTAALDAGDCLIAACSGANFGSTPTITALKRGGSGGTDITPGAADTAYFFGNGGAARGGFALPSGASAETIYAALTNALQIAIAGATYSDVSDAHDWTVDFDVDGSGASTIASLTIPNALENDRCAAIAFCISDSVNMAGFTPVAGTNLQFQYVRAGEGFIGVAVVDKVATADGDCVLSVQCDSAGPGAVGLGWWMGGCAMTGGGGTPSFLAAWAKGSNVVIVGD